MLGVTTTEASGARIIAELIHGHGVSHVFFVPAILRDGLAELGSLGVRSVSAHGEKAAAYMADGYARALGRPGICHVANGWRREYRRRPEGRLPVVQPGDRVHRRHVARDKVPPGLPGDPRLRHVRAGHQVECRSREP